ncbi:VOC family protein [soil metagenome]
MSNHNNQPSFAPELFVNNNISDISFYEKAFGAVETMRFSNEDGSLHVAEFSINGTIFHVHEITADPAFFTPEKHNGATVRIGLFVENVDEVINKAVSAGAIEISPAQDYDYGYRQGIIKDPFGHYWQIQKKI